MENLEMFVKLIILAILVEAVWETLKLTYDKDKLNRSTIGALVVGLVIALSVNFDILEMLGFKAVVPYIGVVLTGILISRGGNYVHDLLKKWKGATVNEQ